MLLEKLSVAECKWHCIYWRTVPLFGHTLRIWLKKSQFVHENTIISESPLHQSLYYIPLGEMLLYVRKVRTPESIIFTLYCLWDIILNTLNTFSKLPITSINFKIIDCLMYEHVRPKKSSDEPWIPAKSRSRSRSHTRSNWLHGTVTDMTAYRCQENGLMTCNHIMAIFNL